MVSKKKDFLFRTGLKQEGRFNSLCEAVIISIVFLDSLVSMLNLINSWHQGLPESERLPLDNYWLHDTIPFLTLNFSPLNYIACNFFLASRYRENRNF